LDILRAVEIVLKLKTRKLNQSQYKRYLVELISELEGLIDCLSGEDLVKALEMLKELRDERNRGEKSMDTIRL
jgi:hypothetical protein